ncbi:MAG: DUF4861 family protein [Vicinamibacterales bacterium]
MKIWPLFPLPLLCIMASGPTLPAAPPGAAVTVRNALDVARPSETIVLTGAAIRKAMAVDDLRTIHVTDDASGTELVVQPIDLNDDGAFDEVIFQADIGPGAARTFSLSAGPRQVYTKHQFKAYGRFVRERRDDFAWENDRVAHRMYGKALETWAQEPLTSSAVDVWFKRTRRLLVNEWYMVDDYHRDLGEGADLYSAGRSRGCGGNGIWDAGRLYTSANFVDSKVFANGPIRVMFELTYPAFDAGGARVTETKRITLDAGHNLNRFESRYAGTPAAPNAQAAGIKKAAGSLIAQDKARGLLRTWEPVKADGSHFGCGVVVDPARLTEFAEVDGNVLAVTTLSAGSDVTYYAGSGWDRSGDFKTVADWDRYLDQAALRIRSPLAVTVASR